MSRPSAFRPYHSVGEQDEYEEKQNSIPTSPILSMSPLTLEVSRFMYPKLSVYNTLCDTKNDKMAELNRKKWQLSERETRIRRESVSGLIADDTIIAGMTDVMIMTDDQYHQISRLQREIGSLIREIIDLEKILLKYETQEMTSSFHGSSLFSPIRPMTQSSELPESP